MRIALDTVADLLVSDVLTPDTGVGDEEALVGSESVDGLQRFVGRGMLESIEGDLQTTVISKVLAKGELTVGV